MTRPLHRAGAREPSGALLRLRVDGERWAEALPPVPDGFLVTIAFSDDALAVEHGEACGLLGYEVAGVWPGDGTDAADILVPSLLVERHRRWCLALLELAEQAWRLEHGPVQQVLAPALEVHLRYRRR